MHLRQHPPCIVYLDNRATVCEDHHRQCEMTTLSCAEVRDAAGIAQVVLPSYAYDDVEYDKRLSPIVADRMRLKGPLFYDRSVQKVLAAGDMLRLFSQYVKHPRLSHLPWSEGINSDDRSIETMEKLIGRVARYAKSEPLPSFRRTKPETRHPLRQTR
jgi:hypothetical protein